MQLVRSSYKPLISLFLRNTQLQANTARPCKELRGAPQNVSLFQLTKDTPIETMFPTDCILIIYNIRESF